jgi:hypothetical protein
LRLVLGLLALALIVGEQRRRLLLELARLIELRLDAGGAVVERLAELTVHAEIAEQTEEHEETQRDPEFSFL